jgi:hypothetical protein
VGDKIAWVPGLRFAEPYKVTDKTTRAIKITINKQKGQA